MIDTVVITVIIIGLIINFIINFITNKKTLSNKRNIIIYLIVLGLSASVLIIASSMPERTTELTLLLYTVVGISLPQIIVNLMTLEDFREASEKFQKFLYAPDIADAVMLRANGEDCKKIIEKFSKKADNYEQMGVINQNKKDEYLATIRYVTDCYQNDLPK